MLNANKAINAFSGITGTAKKFASDLGDSVSFNKPLSYALRSKSSRQAYDKAVTNGVEKDFKFNGGLKDWSLLRTGSVIGGAIGVGAGINAMDQHNFNRRMNSYNNQ